MPELPEVETIVRDIRPALVGRTIRQAKLSHDDVLRGVSRRRLIRRLTDVTIRRVFRRAKHAVLELESDRLVIQPGMTGSLVVHRRPLPVEEAKYAVLRLTLDRGGELVYRDVRRLGTILLLNPREWARYDAAIGPEPLESGFSAEQLGSALRQSRQAIKKVLMDQRRLAGVGNIYANEALFAAGIDPSKPANRLGAEDHRRLYEEIRRILAAAITSNGTTFRDYRTGNGEAGNFQLELMVYGREGESCRRCGTRLTGTHTIDGRISVFCHNCQS
ncbi:MAG TPA: bifunctional DNA-formamidopyrimidine glycosylase/DNA-(apurinic or apyrimidinic site) lyase [Gemmatimonadales bacterium]|jgi:formamidopyrimidine-DNA glycosylase|nr:bifunctional DNA-formamidopyrimidine glycosylase/DNA-(apurinic or apyrimidinic site) lyase [Gemmatimonadales bacterium]